MADGHRIQLLLAMIQNEEAMVPSATMQQDGSRTTAAPARARAASRRRRYFQQKAVKPS